MKESKKTDYIYFLIEIHKQNACYYKKNDKKYPP